MVISQDAGAELCDRHGYRCVKQSIGGFIINLIGAAWWKIYSIETAQNQHSSKCVINMDYVRLIPWRIFTGLQLREAPDAAYASAYC